MFQIGYIYLSFIADVNWKKTICFVTLIYCFHLFKQSQVTASIGIYTFNCYFYLSGKKAATVEKSVKYRLMLHTNCSCVKMDPFPWRFKSLEASQSPVSLTKLLSFRLEWGCAHQL